MIPLIAPECLFIVLIIYQQEVRGHPTFDLLPYYC